MNTTPIQQGQEVTAGVIAKLVHRAGLGVALHSNTEFDVGNRIDPSP